MDVLDAIGPLASNNMAAVIVKPDLPGEKFPWVERKGGEWVAERVWFGEEAAGGCDA